MVLLIAYTLGAEAARHLVPSCCWDAKTRLGAQLSLMRKSPRRRSVQRNSLDHIRAMYAQKMDHIARLTRPALCSIETWVTCPAHLGSCQHMGHPSSFPSTAPGGEFSKGCDAVDVSQ